VKTSLIATGQFYIDDIGVTFRAGTIVTIDGRTTIAWEVVRVQPHSRSYHKVGRTGEWTLGSFAARVRQRWVRRCRVCRCSDAHGCAEGCVWAAIDLCSECTPQAIAEKAAVA